MGLTDKLKDIRKQAQGVVADHKDGIQGAVEAVGSKANERTHGKYADRIARVGDKVSATVDKLGGDAEGAGESEAASTEASAEEAAGTEAAEGTEEQSSGEPPQFA